MHVSGEAGSNSRLAQQQCLALRAKAAELKHKVQVADDVRVADESLLKRLISKERLLEAELVELRTEKVEKLTLYRNKQDEMQNFTETLDDDESNIRHAVSTLQTEADELRHDVQTLKEIRVAECKIDAAMKGQEDRGTQLLVSRRTLVRNVSSNTKMIKELEEKLGRATEKSEEKKRNIEAAIKEIRHQCAELQATSRELEDQVVSAVKARAHRKRELEEVELSLARKRKSLYGCNGVEQ